MKSFSQKTKESLCKLNPPGKSCCINAEMMGILIFAGRIKNGELRVVSESFEVMKRFAVLVKRSCGEAIRVMESGNNFYCAITNKKIIDAVLDYESGNTSIWKLFASNECCCSAFLRGAFWGGGLIVDPQKTYNMEFVTTDERIFGEMQEFLNKLELDFKATKRKSSFVLYSKNTDTICDALAYVGAVSAQMQIINLKIERELRNDINRTNNGELANMDKVINAAGRQIAAINKIEATIGINNLPEDLQEVAFARLRNKDLSLDALGKTLTPPLTKSGVNHRIKRIIEIAEKQ